MIEIFFDRNKIFVEKNSMMNIRLNRQRYRRLTYEDVTSNTTKELPT